MDSNDAESAKITTLSDMKQWALLDFDGGILHDTQFFEDRTQTGKDWIDFVILKSNFENYMPFMEEGMTVLVVRQEEHIRDIIEAFKFKELDEVGF